MTSLLTHCGEQKEKGIDFSDRVITDYDALYHDILDQSVLQLPLDYPVKDLQKMINRIMPDTLVNDTIKLNGKGDYLLLKIVPMGEMLLNGYRNNLDASIPLIAGVHFKKRVGAFNIKNKKPVELRLRIDLHTELALAKDFQLNPTCFIQKIHWIDEPTMKIAGVKVNLKKKISKQIEKNEDIIADAICAAIERGVPIKREVIALWDLLNETHRVARKPVDIWLSMVPNKFSAKFDQEVVDTLRVIVQTQTGVLITPLKDVAIAESPLPENEDFSIADQFHLKVSVNIPYEYLDMIINDQVKGEVISYAGLSATLNNFKTTGNNDQLNLSFRATGDMDVDMEMTTKPVLNDRKELVFDDLEYVINSENLIVNSIDWVANSSVDSYLQEQTKVPLAHILDSLDTKIIRALDRSEFDSKIDLHLDFTTIGSDTTIYYVDRFEWLFSVKGKAHAYLSDSLIVQ